MVRVSEDTFLRYYVTADVDRVSDRVNDRVSDRISDKAADKVLFISNIAAG